MKSAIAAALIVPALFISNARAEEKPLKEKAAKAVETIKRETQEAASAAGRVAREAWKSTKSYLSDDPKEYRDGAVRRVEELASEVTELKAQSQRGALAHRKYFATRVSALKEHLDFARQDLSRLPAEKGGKDYDGSRKRFNQTLESLEAAVDQAQAEAKAEGSSD